LQARHQQSANPLTPVSALSPSLYVFVRIFADFWKKSEKSQKNHQHLWREDRRIYVVVD
jgi:hypothetical protein